jgi:hypothetical protein
MTRVDAPLPNGAGQLVSQQGQLRASQGFAINERF